jgi:hypothetical protein
MFRRHRETRSSRDPRGVGAAIGGAIDAVIYWVIRPSTYVALLGVVGAVVGVAVFTVMKSSKK